MGAGATTRRASRAIGHPAVTVATLVVIALGVLLVALDRHRLGAIVILGGAVLLVAARAHVAAALRERTAELHRLTDLMPVGIFRVAADGAWLYANQHLADVLGAEPGSAHHMQEAWTAAIHPEDRARVLERTTAQAAGADPGHLEHRLLRPDGEERWVGLRTHTHHDAEGRIHGWQGIVTDVTARRTAEQATAASEADHRELAMSIPIGIARRDAAGRLTFVNRMLLEIAGLPPGTTASDISAALFHPDDQAAVVEAMEHTVRTGEAYAREVRVVRPDGELRVVAMRGSMQTGDDGRSTGYLATMIDVTEQRAAERAAEVEARRHRSLMSAVPAGIVRLDAAGSWSYVNDRFRRLWHLAPEQDLEGLDWLSRIHSDDRDRVVEDWRAAMAGGGSYEGEFRILAPDGSWRWAWTGTVREAGGGDEPAGYLATTLDVHERREAEEALGRTERRYRQTINHLPGILIGLYDQDLRCVFMEGEATNEQLNTTACAGRTLGEFANAETEALLGPAMRDALTGIESTIAYLSPRDTSYRENHTGPLRNAQGEVEGVIIVSRDVTEHRLAEEGRRAADRQFRVAFEQAPVGIVDLDLVTGAAKVNQALCTMSGYTADELLAMERFAIVHPDDLAEVRARFAGVGVAEDAATVDHRIRHADGRTIWATSRIALIRDEQGAPAHVLIQIQDVSERRTYEQRLEHMADHDPLTGLLNRRGLERELGLQLARTRRYGGGTLAVLDLDGFKHVNDTLGHAAGDALIAGVAGVLGRCLRETDVVARMGGDEFAVILPGETVPQGAVVARKLLEGIREQTAGLGELPRGRVTASIGLAAFEGELTADEILVRADQAMYDAKASGRDRFAWYAGEAAARPTP